VSLAGETHVQRSGLSVLNQVGLGDLVAHDRSSYERIGIALSSNVEKLAELRSGLRQRMEKSPLRDTQGLARALEHEYRVMWRRWCTS
jgi:protein O-GlcNAc transferase